MNLLKRTSSGRASEHASPIPRRIIITKIEDLPSCPSGSSLKPRTQPIPIKPSKTSHRESSYESDEEVDRAQYDLATWNMYVLITNARRLRAVARSLDGSITGDTSSESSEEQPPVPQVYRDQDLYIPTESTDLDESSDDECYDDIFELDPE